MIRRLTRNVVVLVLMLVFPAASAADDDDAAVRKVFDAYKSAVLNGEGAAAANLLSAATVDYYVVMRDRALYAAEQEIRELEGMDMLMVLRLRDAIAADRLRQMTGYDLVTYAVAEGWVGKESVESLSITAVKVDGDTAVVDVLTEHGPYAGGLRFRREADAWKLDLLQVMQVGNAAFDQLARQQGVKREDFAFSLLEKLNGKPVNPAIWQPPLKRP